MKRYYSSSNQIREFLTIAQTQVDRKCREGPGHIYNLPGAMDRQAEARKESAAAYSFPHTARLKVSKASIAAVLTCVLQDCNSPVYPRSPHQVPLLDQGYISQW